MSLFRLALRSYVLSASIPITRRVSTQVSLPRVAKRNFAIKGRMKSTDELVPGSKQRITDEAALAEYTKADTSMTNAVEWFRRECQGLEIRASGRVTPNLLSPVRVKVSDREYRLEDIATVGVRDGTTLLVTLFDENVSCLSMNLVVILITFRRI